MAYPLKKCAYTNPKKADIIIFVKNPPDFWRICGNLLFMLRKGRASMVASKKKPATARLDNKSLQAKIKKVWNRDWQLFVLCLPALIYVAIFCYGPMYGILIAFKDFSARQGIIGSDWIGFDHFIRFFNSPNFWVLLRNTLTISLYTLIAGFPFPIFLLCCWNQAANKKFRKFVQTVIYAPHFISVVVMCGMITLFFSYSTGIVNTVLTSLGFDRIFFMGSEKAFPHLYVWSDIWQSTGWGTIIYIAALGAISQDQYEAAKIDGASKWKMLLHIDIPNLMPTILTMFILRVGSVMSIGFQKAFLLQTSMNLGASEIISTYVYKVGLVDAKFDYSTAIGLFNNIINIILLLLVNKLSKKLSDDGGLF